MCYHIIMKEINTSFSSFETIIRNNFLYVDKTEYIYRMVAKGPQMIFLSRPRRFGKSLTLSTLEAVFKGKRELFKGLYIDSTDYDWKEYPVIHFDFGLCGAKTADECEIWINGKLDDIASEYGVKLEKALYFTKFDRLITALRKKAPVVILIDEYDKMLSSNIYNPEVEAIRDVLRGFFEVIKARNDSLQFVFITGVTKYSKVSIFSSMNNLKDYTMKPQFAYLCGYTQEELEKNFGEYIEKGLTSIEDDRDTYLNKLKTMYDGYRFVPGADTVYNPVSIGSFFDDGGEDFESYWIDTGGSKLLMDIAKRVHFNIAKDLDKPVNKDRIKSFDILEMTTGNLTTLKYKALLLQSGYLTIKNQEKNSKDLLLGFPNEEVKEALSHFLLEVYGGEEAGENFDGDNLMLQFENGNTQGIMDNLFSVYAAIPYREEQKIIEADYQGMFYAMMIIIHAEVYLEILTNKGRIDAVVKTPKHVYVIEFKRDESAEKALSQIKDKGYHEKYRAWSSGFEKKVHLLGINFSTEKRNIESWKEEIID